MRFDRSSGVLLHITSLPGSSGIGTIGKEARAFADIMKRAGFRYWQILPIGPVRDVFGYSPYATTSTFAGNSLFISLQDLAKEHWFTGYLDPSRFSEAHLIPFDEVATHSESVLRRAHESFRKNATNTEKARYQQFCDDNNEWLHDHALYSSLSVHFKNASWPEWEPAIASRKPSALQHWHNRLHDEIDFHMFIQYCFFGQWREFKQYVNDLGIDLIGDIPIYITMESSDAWAHPEILQLDPDTGLPTSVAGVPPDYFSETGQRWGNPLYRWLDGSGTLNGPVVSWWTSRIRHLRGLVDIIRVDHFRGFESYWSIPYKEETAVRGEWMEGPGGAFFETLRGELGDLPLIAEDLGLITPEVEELRDSMQFPGMRILQFAFDFNNRNTYLPHNIDNRNCILYTGTHDNNTTNGWFYGTELSDDARRYVMEYLGIENFSDFHWHMIRLAYRSVADLVILPAQDILGFGGEFRMNTPGTCHGNWGWKLVSGSITEEMIQRIRRMAAIYRREPED
jgi:4-alpha-glucanotransferase